MAALQRLHSSLCAHTGGYVSPVAQQNLVSDQFPTGLRVLVVDDDVITLKILEKMSRRCRYHGQNVYLSLSNNFLKGSKLKMSFKNQNTSSPLLLPQVTTCSQAAVALNLLRERKGCFDVVLSDVNMPDLDGYKLLQHIALEMDLPVIMMSADGSTSAVMKGVKHGACDYLVKPVREEEMRNIWQHVVRKWWTENKNKKNSGNLDSDGRLTTSNSDMEYASSPNEEMEGKLKVPRKRTSSKEGEEGENKHENDDPSASKKSRVVWSMELHQQFVNAVCNLGLEKAVPKRILELMDVPGLTRENVASHLQKFRLYLKRINAVVPQQTEVSVCGSVESNDKMASLGRLDMQAFAASGQIPPQTLAAIHAELFGLPIGNLLADDPTLVQGFVQGSKHTPVEFGVAYDQPLARCPPNVVKQCPESILTVETASNVYGAWPSSIISSVGLNKSLGGMVSQDGEILEVLQHQKNKQCQIPQLHSLIPENNHLINVHPSCLVIPLQTSCNSQVYNAALVNQECSFDDNYCLLSAQQNNSMMNIGPYFEPGSNTGRIPGRHTAPGSISSSFASCSNGNFHNGSTTSAVGQAPLSVPDMSEIQGSFVPKSKEVLKQRSPGTAGFVGNEAFMASSFFMNNRVLTMNNMSPRKSV